MSDSKDFEKLPATHKHVDETRDELKSDIASLRVEMNSKFKEVDARFNEVDARFDKLEAKIEKLSSVVEDQNAKIHRNNALFEEMLQQNKMMLDSMTINNDRIDRLEKALLTQ